MAHFYLNELIESAAVGDRVSIDGPEARHAVTVSRLAVGETVSIGNGRGLVATGPIVTAEHTELAIEVAEIRDVPRGAPAIVLAQALAKGDRDELAVQVSTELGVDAVIPWTAARSISRWEGSKIAKGHDRWSAITREASKQSIRAWLPDVLDLVSTNQLAKLAAHTHLLVLEPTAEQALTAVELDDRDVVLVVGPEGGIAPHELDALVAAGASLVRLGDGVLRTSTAGPAAIAVLSAKLTRW
ncbi:16S rRNA (uracil(1498)-N(3))-methyltransferase [Glaciihabitans arcticus]|uniref:Ribosomal RNA small subunit methyltransferase E n=1 Tax=Glaciihabitans arcticus TaxID=2668039 RepID=A0A4Q9GQK4_9MICO|nr:16S rRNA (uracil(1498)-N(3))-methyltransferase [Glaciihabitans arcticus]TBN56961.1 16S rRNA (uracil(1498)-N(3))-methyltransferase [Glaciihabitans arcticus]